MTLQHFQPNGLVQSANFSQVVAATGAVTIFISGQVSLDAKGDLVAPDDLPGQAHQVYANLRVALEAVGASPGDVTKLTTYVVRYRPEYLAVLTEARTALFGAMLPASTLVGVQALAQPGFLVEVEAIAVID